MTNAPRSPAPIVLVAAALITGAAVGGVRPAPEAAGPAALVAVLLALLTRRRRSIVVLLAASAAFAAGAAAQGVAWRDAGRRLDATFGPCATRELEIIARVLAAPERYRDGGAALLCTTGPEASAPGLRIRLDIADVPHDDRARFAALRRGDVVRVWCRLRAPVAGPGITESAARRRLAAQRLDATGRVKSSRLVRQLARGSWRPDRALDMARVHARLALDRAVGETGESRAVLGALLLGDRLLLDEATNAIFRDSGLVHILSISGLHTALSVLLLLGLLRRVGFGARGMLVTGGALLLAFAAFVGHGASVWRACGCLGVGLLARVLARDVDPLAALGLTAALFVLVVPSLALNVGFLLSVIATAGLVAAVPPALEGERRPSVFSRSLAASAGAYLGTAPLLACTFGRLAPVALAANLLAAPLCAACLVSGAAAIVCSSVPVIGVAAGWTADATVKAMLLVARAAVAVPGGHLRVASPSVALVAAYVILLVTTYYWPPRYNRSAGRAVRLFFSLCAIALHLGPPPPGRGPARVEVLDVGQGLAVLLRGPDGRFVLVDTGSSAGGRFDAGDRIVVPALAARGCRRLDVLVLSHDHDDHAGGARAVLRDLEVGELWLAAGSEHDPLTRIVTADAVSRGVAVRRMIRGDEAARGGLVLSVLHPGRDDRARPLNDRCLAIRARTPDGASVVLPGDLESSGEAALLANGADLRSAALVAPHHGADGSGTLRFLLRTAPGVVLVSAGAGNRFGHPGNEALARFATVGASVLRTDLDGTITLEDVGGSWRASVENQRRRDEGERENGKQCERQRQTARP